MKKLIAIILFLQSLNGHGQNMSSIKFEKEYKTISISQVTKSLPRQEIKDTVTLRDTIYISTKQEVAQNITKPVVEPLVMNVHSPLSSLDITSNYGMRFHPIKRQWLFHSGVDFGAYKDTVRSVIDGVVHSSGYNSGLGYYVKIETGNYVVTYAHLSQYFCLEKMKVSAGDALGITGSTGLSTGEHLHFSVHHNGNSINPVDFLHSLIRLKATLALNIANEKPSNQTISN